MSSARQICIAARTPRLPVPLGFLSLMAALLLVPCAGAQTLAPRPQPASATVAETEQGTALPGLDLAAPQSTAAPAAGTPICGITRLGRCIQDLAEDDKGIFTSPLRLRPKDAYWLMPFGAATGLAFAYDTDAENAEGYDKNRENTANLVSNFGSFYASGGWGAALYFTGLARHNAKLAETGRLGAEAVIDSGTVVLAGKLITNRERPIQGDHKGSFWTNGSGSWSWDSSFPSDHSTASMSLARVIAGEYPHWYVAVPAYGFAETIAVSRILANAHFPSDVIVGQTIGFLTGSYILNRRSLYRGKKHGLAARILESTTPIASTRQHAYGAQLQIPFGQ